MIYDLADEQKGRQGSGVATDDPITKSSGAGGSGKVAIRHQPLDTLSVHDLVRLRGIILTVIDDGPSGREQWHFYEDRDTTESGADADRLDFCDEVQRRVVAMAVK